MLRYRHLGQTENPPSLPFFKHRTSRHEVALAGLGRAVLAVPGWAAPAPAVPGALVVHWRQGSTGS